MIIYNSVKLHGLSIYLINSKTLVLSDIHIGYEEALNKDGVMIPRLYFKHLFEKTKNLLEEFDIKTIVLNGDVKHELGKISRSEWKDTKNFFEMLKQKTKDIILIKGNHDNLIEPIAKINKIKIAEYHISDDVIICHGDVLLDINKIEKENNSKINKIILGHTHPAISIGNKNRTETYKCFLAGDWNKRKLILMPSYNEITIGVDVTKENLSSPFLKNDVFNYSKINNFNVYIYGDDVLDFGKVKELKNKFG